VDSYSAVREVGGNFLKDNNVFTFHLNTMKHVYQMNLIFLMETIKHFDLFESQNIENSYKIFRILSPIAKALSAKDAIKLCSESIEMVGGIG